MVFKAHPATKDLKIYYFYTDLSSLISGMTDLDKIQCRMGNAVQSWSQANLNFNPELTNPYIADVMDAISSHILGKNIVICYLWDEIQYLLKHPTPGFFKGVISNQTHRNFFSVCTGSGMAMAWEAFNKMSTADHSIFQTIDTIHLPFHGSELGVYQALYELQKCVPEYGLDEAGAVRSQPHEEILAYALTVCPHSVTGTCYYAGNMAKCKTVRLLSPEIALTVM